MPHSSSSIPWHRRIQGLMPHLMREVLLVSSAYDAFVLEEDGPLSQRLVNEYSELSLTSVPRLTHVPSVADAMRLFAERRFDLVITVVRVEDGDAAHLSAQIKQLRPEVPVVLLTFDEADLRHFPHQRVPDTVDRAFLWTGDAWALIAAIKLTEDTLNAAHDARTGDVHTILVVEDQMRFYSTFLALLYPELFHQSRSMLAEAQNNLHRRMRLRTRPKILLANDYDQAMAHIAAFRRHTLAMISDVRFPRGSVRDGEAGFALASAMRAQLPGLPILLLSHEDQLAERARELDVWQVSKAAPNFPSEIRRFLKEAVGFGDFIFRRDDGRMLGHARNVYELEQAIHRIPDESIHHHAARNDFSVWLRARGMFALADELHPRDLSEFADIEALRHYLLEVLAKARDRDQAGVITDVSGPSSESASRFIRIGSGSIGGKGRGIAFANALIAQERLGQRFDNLRITIPHTAAISTEAFSYLVEQCPDLVPKHREQVPLERWLEAALAPEIASGLEAACAAWTQPLAVRSSSVLEDSRFRPFAGVYSTFMIPNCHPSPRVRIAELLRAIKAVFASAFTDEARTYLAGTPHVMEDQRMAVIVQEVVGQRYGNRFYPLLSGVAQSYNFYPVGRQRAEDGVAIIALGLGETVVRGGNALRFSPGRPKVLPQFPDAKTFARRSQTQFYALDLAHTNIDLSAGDAATLVQCGLDVAEADGTLAAIGSVYSLDDEVLRDNLDLAGPRVVTFNNILRWKDIPLAAALSLLLEMFRDGVGSEVEIEFAVDHTRPEDWPPHLYVLQVRPLPPWARPGGEFAIDDVPATDLLLRSNRALGHGNEEVHDIVYIRRTDLDFRETQAAAKEVRALTDTLHKRECAYILLGPGRWGTTDPALGIPVQWRDIAGARVIVELPLEGRFVEPSQGSHFFHNLTALRIGYLTLSTDRASPHNGDDDGDNDDDDHFDRTWLDAQPAAHESEFVRHITVPQPLRIQMDGTRGRAVIRKP